MRLNCIDELFDESIFQKKKVVFFLNVAYHYVNWFDHQCFLVHVSYKILFFKTNYEHQNNVNKWHISDVVEEHSSIFFVNAIDDEHRFIFFDQHEIVWCIDHFVRKRHFIYESIQIINKWIITIKIVNNASSKRIVKRFVNKHICIFKWFQICHICKFNVWDIIFCCFFTVRFFVIVVFWFAIFCLDIIQNVNVNYFFNNKEEFSWFQNRVFQSFFLLLIALLIWWSDSFNNVLTIFSIMHVFARTLSFFAFITLCRDRERRFLRLKLRLWLILKNDYINMFNCF